VGAASAENTLAPGSIIQEDAKNGLRVATGEGVLLLQKLQLPGGKPLTAREFLNGRSLQGEILGHQA
jgi:methionyl-tRNA formyltransferase